MKSSFNIGGSTRLSGAVLWLPVALDLYEYFTFLAVSLCYMSAYFIFLVDLAVNPYLGHFTNS